MRSLKASEGAIAEPNAIRGEAWDTFQVSTAKSGFSLSNAAKLTTLLLSLSGCSDAVSERASSPEATEPTPVHQPMQKEKEFLSQSSVEILHLPQIHNDLDGKHSPVAREAVSRFQFELAKRIIELIQAEPSTVVFSEGSWTERSVDTLFQTYASEFLSSSATKIETEEGVVTVLNPIPEESSHERFHRAVSSLLEPITRHVVHDGKIISIINESDLAALLRDLQLSELGLTKGFPQTYEEANESLKESLYDGAVPLLLLTGFIKTVYPAEKLATLEEIFELKNSEQLNNNNKPSEQTSSLPESRGFGRLLVESPAMRDLIVRQREADLAELVQAYVSDPAHTNTKKVLVVFGAAHDLSEEFEPFPKFSRDEEMDTKIRKSFRVWDARPKGSNDDGG